MSQNLISLRKVLVFAALAVVMTIPASVSAQSDPARSVVEGYIAAQHRLDWKAAASYIAPTDLAEFKKTFQSIFAGIPGPIDTTILRPASFGKRNAADIASADSVSYFAGIFTTIFDLYPVMGEMATTATDSILGSVNEGDTLKHFLCRVNAKLQQEKISNIEVVSLQKIGGKWFVIAKRSIEQMANLMRRSIR